EAFAGIPAGLLRGGREALLAEQGDGLLDVPVARDEGVLAIHESGARALAKLLDRRGGDVCHVLRVLLFSVDGGPSGPRLGRRGAGRRRGRAARISGRVRARTGSAGGGLGLLGRFARELGGDLVGGRLGRG